MTPEHPITPPDELVRQWTVEYRGVVDGSIYVEEYIATQTSRFRRIADTELEACCKALEDIWDRTYHDMTIVDILHELRAARRPKPPSLAEQGLAELKEIMDELHEATGSGFTASTIRRALKRLQELENNG